MDRLVGWLSKNLVRRQHAFFPQRDARMRSVCGAENVYQSSIPGAGIQISSLGKYKILHLYIIMLTATSKVR